MVIEQNIQKTAVNTAFLAWIMLCRWTDTAETKKRRSQPIPPATGQNMHY